MVELLGSGRRSDVVDLALAQRLAGNLVDFEVLAKWPRQRVPSVRSLAGQSEDEFLETPAAIVFAQAEKHVAKIHFAWSNVPT